MSALRWRIVAPILALMLAQEPPNLADVRPMLSPMLAPTPSRSQSFRSGTPPNTQNHEKPMVF